MISYINNVAIKWGKLVQPVFAFVTRIILTERNQYLSIHLMENSNNVTQIFIYIVFHTTSCLQKLFGGQFILVRKKSIHIRRYKCNCISKSLELFQKYLFRGDFYSRTLWRISIFSICTRNIIISFKSL